MIKYMVKNEKPKCPENKLSNCSSIKELIDRNEIYIGCRLIIRSHFVTCVDIDSDKYIFAYDELFTNSVKYDEIKEYLKHVAECGEIIPPGILNEIDFLFIPSEYQIFGGNTYAEEREIGIKQFAYFTDDGAIFSKPYKGVLQWYWLSNKTECSTYFCDVFYNGDAGTSSASNPGGVPIFFQVTKD